MNVMITSTHIIVERGAAGYAQALTDTACDCGGHEVCTFKEALREGLPIWCVDDAARGKSSYGMNGALYVGDAGHPADHRVA